MTRTASVRTFERAGVPRSVAMSIVGHKTESIYRRYPVVEDPERQHLRCLSARCDSRALALTLFAILGPMLLVGSKLEAAKRGRKHTAVLRARVSAER